MSPHLKKGLEKMDIDLDIILRQGDITLDDLKIQVKKDNLFCRDEKSINYKYFLNLLSNDIVLYASLEGKVLGALTFMFNIKEGNKIIILDGICCPKKYSGQHIGEELINTLIRIGKQNDIRYINLECKGSVVNYYHNKFGFEVINIKTTNDSDYDSDDNSDDESDEEHSRYYYMMLDLSRVSGGKIKRNIKSKMINKSIKKRKRKNSTRKRRKLRKF
jgi:N-acetylglutamate synthase-like GNAT family acetyltransferase